MIYQYKREDEKIFEVKQGINDEPLTKCPETGLKCKRIITGGADILFVGSKWPDKQVKKEKQIKENPYLTTLPDKQKIIDKNSEKAREMKSKRINLSEI